MSSKMQLAEPVVLPGFTDRGLFIFVHLNIAAILAISWRPRLFGEPVMMWAEVVFLVYIWARTLFVMRMRKKSAERAGTTAPPVVWTVWLRLWTTPIRPRCFAL